MRSIWVLGASLLCATFCCADVVHGGPIWALWTEQHVRFAYLGRTSRYSCEGLRERVRALLLELGARRDLRIGAACAPAANDSGALNLDIVFFSLGPHDAKRPLDAAASIAAAYQPFSITTDPFRNIGVADCELVEEFALQILPKFVTRDLKEEIGCELPQDGGAEFVVRGEILRNAPSR